MKTAIICDSSCYMSNEYLDKYNIKTVPLTVNFENVTYKEVMNDEKTTNEIFKKIELNKIIPTTSQPSVTEFLKKFEEALKDGYERILVFTITCNLSGTIQGATNAANMFMEENNIKIEVFDTNSVGPGASIVILEVAKRLEKNKDTSKNKILEIIDFYQENVQIFLVVGKLDFLAYGGRISSSIAALGNLFEIKPLLCIDAGVFNEHGKYRSKKKAFLEIKKQYELYINKNKDAEYILLSAFTSSNKEVKKVAKMIEKSLDKPIKTIPSIPLGPVVAMHVGPDTVGIGFTKLFED